MVTDTPSYSERINNQDESKVSGCVFIVLYLFIIIIIDIIALVAEKWLYYLFLGGTVLPLWAYALHTSSTDENNNKIFWRWHIPNFLLFGSYFVFNINPIKSYWEDTWQALIILGLFFIIGGITIFIKSKDKYGLLVVATLFGGIIGTVFGIFQPPADGASVMSLWLYNSSNQISVIFFYLSGIGTIGKIIYITITEVEFPSFIFIITEGKMRVPQPIRSSGGAINILLDQLEVIFNVFLLIFDYLIGTLIWLIKYTISWIVILPLSILEFTITVFQEVLILLRGALLQAPLHTLAAVGFWTINFHLYGYLYRNESVFIFLWYTFLGLISISVCFLISVPLILGTEEFSDYPPVLTKLSDGIQLVTPHALVVFVGVCWSLIFLNHFFGIGNFTIGLFTILSTLTLITILIYAIKRRRAFIY